MIDIRKIADAADMIVNGYAFTQGEEGCRVLNLNRPDKAVVLSKSGEVLETSMDDIEIQIVKGNFEGQRNSHYTRIYQTELSGNVSEMGRIQFRRILQRSFINLQ